MSRNRVGDIIKEEEHVSAAQHRLTSCNIAEFLRSSTKTSIIIWIATKIVWAAERLHTGILKNETIRPPSGIIIYLQKVFILAKWCTGGSGA